MYSPHTACDAVFGGVNDWLADGVRECDQGRNIAEDGHTGSVVEILGEEKVHDAGVIEGGEGRLVRFDQPIIIDELEARIKRHLNLTHSKPASPYRDVVS